MPSTRAPATDPNSLLFTEQQNGVPLTSGVFSVNIGSQTGGGVPDSALATDPNNPSAGVWLGTSVNAGAELTPRTRLVMVPYAAKATVAEGLVKPGTFHQVATIDGGELHIVPDAADYPAGLKIGSSAAGESNMTVRLSQPSGGYVRIQAHKNYGTTFGDISLNADGGRVGIGTTNPEKQLHLRGQEAIVVLENTNDPSGAKWRIEPEAVGETNFGIVYDGGTGLHPRFVITPNGNVGIGIESPQTTLHVEGTVRGDVVQISNGTGMGTNSDSSGVVTTFGANGSVNASLSNLAGYPNNGYVGVRDAGNTLQCGMYVDSSGNGIVWGDTKSFRAPNPNNRGTEIWYACIEGPEAAAYVRGTATLVNGNAVIELPDHFQAVATEQSMTVQLTPLSADSLGLAVVRKSLAGIVVKELYRGTGTYDFDYLVTAVRKGHENYRVIRPATEGLPADTWTTDRNAAAPAQEE